MRLAGCPLKVLVLILGASCLVFQTILAQEAEVEYFPCGTDHCSFEKKEYCHEREKTCHSCQREMQQCGKPGMQEMRTTCWIYCVQGLKEDELVQEYKSTMQANNKTYDRKLTSLEMQIGNKEGENEKLRQDLATKDIHFSAVAAVLGVLLLISLIFNFLQYRRVGCFRPTSSGKDMVMTPTEEEALIESGSGNSDDTKQLATAAVDEGMGSELNTPSESTEALAPAKTSETLVGVAPDRVGERSGEPSRPTPERVEEKPAVKTGLSDNGLGFADLPRDANNATDGEEDPVNLAQNQDGSLADLGTILPLSQPPLSQPICRMCRRNSANAMEQMCASCRAQQLSAVPGPAPGPDNGPSGGNSDPPRDFQTVMSSIKDTDPSNSKFTPSGAPE